MGLAVELYFEPAAEQRIRDFRQLLAGQGIPSALDIVGDRPHISLAVLPDQPAAPILTALETFARRTRPFSVMLSALGAFPTAEGVVYLSPAPTAALISAHGSLHEALASARADVVGYYLPDRWVPHCTVAMNLPPAQVAAAVEYAVQAFEPLAVTCREIGLVAFRPVVPIQAYMLGSE